MLWLEAALFPPPPARCARPPARGKPSAPHVHAFRRFALSVGLLAARVGRAFPPPARARPPHSRPLSPPSPAPNHNLPHRRHRRHRASIRPGGPGASCWRAWADMATRPPGCHSRAHAKRGPPACTLGTSSPLTQDRRPTPSGRGCEIQLPATAFTAGQKTLTISQVRPPLSVGSQGVPIRQPQQSSRPKVRPPSAEISGVPPEGNLFGWPTGSQTGVHALSWLA